jgi:hypothetical protein
VITEAETVQISGLLVDLVYLYKVVTTPAERSRSVSTSSDNSGASTPRLNADETLKVGKDLLKQSKDLLEKTWKEQKKMEKEEKERQLREAQEKKESEKLLNIMHKRSRSITSGEKSPGMTLRDCIYNM